MSVLLAETYTPNIDPTGWWASEKLDGIRAIWTGKNLVSRNGNIFRAPPKFIESFSNIPMDGELWLGRKVFDETSSIVQTANDPRWSRLKYIVFDIPNTKAGVVETRWELLKQVVKDTNKSHLEYMPQMKCTGREQLTKLLDLIILQGAEGLMLRRPNSIYEGKRSSTLLKVKRFHDAEAKVIGHTVLYSGDRIVPGLGALECVTDKGVKFKVGTGFSELQRRFPPKIGSTITFKYQELSKAGVPRFPVYVCERNYE